MPTSPEPRREIPSTYVVQDRENEEELARLRLQDAMFTQSMGGVLPEQEAPERFQHVLDVGCGTGGWLIETAKTYPSISKLFGVDISGKMLDYARAQAAAQQVDDRVEFLKMDALLMLEFPAGYFDLVNHRLAASWLRTWEWTKLLQEYERVCRSGGIIRVTEADFTRESSSPALNRIFDLLRQALYQSGHYPTVEGDSVLRQLEGIFQRFRIQQVQTHPRLLEYRAGTPEWQGFFEDGKRGGRTMLPFLRKWLHIPDDYEETYQQSLVEMQRPDFVGTVEMLTIWGIRE